MVRSENGEWSGGSKRRSNLLERRSVCGAASLGRRDGTEHGREHGPYVSAERRGDRAKRHGNDARQNRIFHGADTAFIANEPFNKFTHFYIPLT